MPNIYQIFHIYQSKLLYTKHFENIPIFSKLIYIYIPGGNTVPNATCRSRQWCRISKIELPNYVVTVKRFHWGTNIGCLPLLPCHRSYMSDQLLMWHNAAYLVYYAQRQVSASLWNATSYSGRSAYIKSV